MIMLKSTHRRLMAEQVKADIVTQNRQTEHWMRAMKLFQEQIVEQAAAENANLKRELIAAQDQIAALNGKLIHHMDNPEAAVLATSGRAKPRDY
jgi:regulator of protease activity HflC (stomatin/prohibitin superfamily)